VNGIRSRTERGASVVEFALVFPILAILLFGIITAGLSYSHALGITNAVREGTRFGATTDASTATGSTWSADVIDRVRESQFDDSTDESRICVQLWKLGSPGSVVVATRCDGPGTLTIPNTGTGSPSVPSGPAGSCVVRVIASRPYSIFAVVASWDRTMIRGSVARYERKDKVTTCS